MLAVPLHSPSFLVHALGLVVTGAVSVAVARWVSRQASDEASRTMAALLSMHAVMAALFLLELLVESLALKAFLSGTYYGLILATPVLWFAFAVYYTGRDHWLTTPVRVLLGVSALVPFAVAVTNPLHRVLVVDWVVRTDPFRYQRAVFSDLNHALFLVVSVYTLAGFVLLFRLMVFSRRAGRWQSIGLLAGIASVYGSAVLSVTSYAPITNFPYGIYGSGVFGVIVAVSLFRTRMFAVAPLARDALFDSLGDAVVVVNADRRLVDFNDRALAVFPSLDGGVGRPLDEVCPALVDSAESAPEGVGFDAPALTGESDVLTDAGDSPFAGTVQRTVDGTVRSFNVTVSEITRGGTRHGYGLVVSDVTTLVEYSTALEAKTERLEQFASVLSHDLRNPLTVAMGSLELEAADGDSEHLCKTRAALDRMEATIDDLLDLARSGDDVVDPSRVSLANVATDAWNTAATGEATLSVEVGNDVEVSADRSRLRTLFENLFRNAADHGGSTVTVGTIGEGTESPSEAGFFVADDGPGIPDDERDDVFEYGYSTTDDGTGFGLAIVNSVAQAHGWSLAVTESQSKGARFDVTGASTFRDQRRSEVDGPSAGESTG